MSKATSTTGEPQPTPPALIGALDPTWFTDWLEARGRWGFHVAHRRNAEAILREGLLPWDARAQESKFTAAATPRPGHVYCVTDKDGCDHQWELSSIDPRDGIVVCVDLTRIAPARIVPDEDPWTLGLLDPEEPDPWGLDRRVSEKIGVEKRWRTGGDWAQEIRLGAQAGIVEWALTAWGRFAIGGRVEPDTLRIVDCEADGTWTTPTG